MTASGWVPHQHAAAFTRGVDRERSVGVSTGVIIIAMGAVLRFGTTVRSTGFNTHTVGLILMVVGILVFLASLAFWESWGGFSDFRRHNSHP